MCEKCDVIWIGRNAGVVKPSLVPHMYPSYSADSCCNVNEMRA